MSEHATTGDYYDFAHLIVERDTQFTVSLTQMGDHTWQATVGVNGDIDNSSAVNRLAGASYDDALDFIHDSIAARMPESPVLGTPEGLLRRELQELRDRVQVLESRQPSVWPPGAFSMPVRLSPDATTASQSGTATIINPQNQ